MYINSEVLPRLTGSYPKETWYYPGIVITSIKATQKHIHLNYGGKKEKEKKICTCIGKRSASLIYQHCIH